jgi:multicomponent Na+:H+ antiporter subunit D
MNHIRENLPALIVVLPLLSGLLVSLFGRSGRAWKLTTVATTLLFAMTVWLCTLVLASPEGFISFNLGGWEPQTLTTGAGTVSVGIEYRVDCLNALVLGIVAGIGAIVTPFARLSVAKEIPEDRLHFFYAVYLLCITGLMGIAITGDAFNVYVLLEISSLTAYALVAMGKEFDRRALTAAFHYLIMGTVGASFVLLGIGYLFMVTGTLNMAEMAQQLAMHSMDRTVITAFALIIVGLSLKMGLFPLHQWLPNAYTYAPTAVTALLASTATKVGIYVGLRFFFTIFRKGDLKSMGADALIFFSCTAIIFGSVRAIQQVNIKRLLAYSSVAQVGYMVLGFAMLSHDGYMGSLLHMVNHALVKGALFLAVGAAFYRTGSMKIESLKGLFRTMPVVASAIAVGGIALIGLPLTGGFISKWFLVGAAIEGGSWAVAAVILFGSVLAIVYVLRLVEPMVFAQPGEGPQVSRAPLSLSLPAWVLIAGSIYCGLDGSAIRRLVEGAAGAISW